MDLLLGLAETQVESEYVHYFFTGKGTYMEKYKTRNGDGEESGRTMKWKEAEEDENSNEICMQTKQVKLYINMVWDSEISSRVDGLAQYSLSPQDS